MSGGLSSPSMISRMLLRMRESTLFFLPGAERRPSPTGSKTLRQKGLKFDEVHLADENRTPKPSKSEQIKRIIEEHPSLERVEMWEDFVDMVPPYRASVKEAGLKV